MNFAESTGLWAAGYRPANLMKDQPEDRDPIVKIGWAVLFATLVAGINWGVAGWIYTAGQEVTFRWLVTAMTAVLGMTLVLLFDRSFLYFADTRAEGGRRKMALYAGMRVLLVALAGSITSQAVMPLFLNSELKTHALSMIEASEKTRTQELSTRYDIAGKNKALRDSEADVAAIRKSLHTLPDDIRQALTSAQDCWADYAAQRRGLIDSGQTPENVRAALSGKATACAFARRDALKRESDYKSDILAQLSRALSIKNGHEASFKDAEQTIRTKLQRAQGIEGEAYNPRSSTVLWSLVRSDPGSLAKWLLVSVVLLVLELLPLLMKLQAERSAPGQRIASERQTRLLSMRESAQRNEHEYAIASAVNTASMKAVDAALINPTVHAEFVRAFSANMAAFAPVESVRAMMRELESRNVDVQDFMYRHPRYAKVIGQAWTNAMAQTADILKRGMSSPARQGGSV